MRLGKNAPLKQTPAYLIFIIGLLFIKLKLNMLSQGIPQGKLKKQITANNTTISVEGRIIKYIHYYLLL
jgi:hypothetical protein